MERRSFMSFLGGAAAGLPSLAADAASDQHNRFYVVEHFYLKNGSQPQRIHDYLKNAAIPALKRAGAGPVAVLEALIAPHMPQVTVIVGVDSLDHLWKMHEKVIADKELLQQYQAWEQGDEPAVESMSSMILQATDYSPELVADREPRKNPRVFELRVYHSPTGRQLRALHERFAGPEIKIFHRSGVHPVLYTSTLIGPNMPNLTYLIPFDSLDAREKAWNAFGADPEWQKVRKESIDKYGQIASVIQISLYKATAYSPVG
jgi:hypothetical protein